MKDTQELLIVVNLRSETSLYLTPFCVNLYWFYTNKNAKTNKKQTNNVGIRGLTKMKTKKDVLLANIIHHSFIQITFIG